MNRKQFNVLLADDDIDDCGFFKKALSELQLFTQLKIVHDGEELMKYLEENSTILPDVLFLDLSMPRKTGFECLTEIKENDKLKDLSVTVFTTSFSRGLDFEKGMAKMLNKIGAEEYIRKPGDFMLLKEIIFRVITRIQTNQASRRSNNVLE